MLEKMDCTKTAYGSTAHLSMVANAIKLTGQARKQGYDKHIHDKGVDRRFLGKEFILPYEQKIYQLAQKIGSTTHMCTADKEGNLTSMTTSHGEGSGYLIPGTDIMFNNMLGEEDLNACVGKLKSIADRQEGQ